MRPPTSHSILPCGMIAEGGMHRGVIGDALVKSCRCQREESPLRGTRHTTFLAVPRGMLLNIVESADTTQYHMLIITLVAVVHPELPIAAQGPVVQVVIHLLLHRHGDTVDTDLQGDGPLRCRIDITAIGTDTSPRHPQQSGILALLHRHTEDAIGTVAPTHIVETHLIDIHILRATLGQQSFRGVKIRLACHLDGILPEVTEVLGHHRRGLQSFRREGGTTGSLVILTIHMRRHIHTVEAGLLHRARQSQGAVLQHHALLHVLIHLRTCGIVDAHVVEQRTRLEHVHRKRSLLTRLVCPVLMVGLHRHHDIITPYLGKHLE